MNQKQQASQSGDEYFNEIQGSIEADVRRIADVLSTTAVESIGEYRVIEIIAEEILGVTLPEEAKLREQKLKPTDFLLEETEDLLDKLEFELRRNPSFIARLVVEGVESEEKAEIEELLHDDPDWDILQTLLSSPAFFLIQGIGEALESEDMLIPLGPGYSKELVEELKELLLPDMKEAKPKLKGKK